MAQEDGDLNILNKTSDYLGENWTSLPDAKEDLITVRHQLTMTTGLDYNVADVDCTLPGCLQYKADAGDQWFYHNAPYTLLEQVVSNATATDYNQYTNEKLESKIGMDGTWIKSGYNNVYWSKARDAARYGLLILNEGKWDETQIMTDADYFNDMVNTSQALNPSYGYLWWLNGKGSVIFPGLPNSFAISMSDNAPSDLFAAMGKNGQFIDVVPSLDLVVVRMGEAPDGSLVPVQFHDDMWAKIMDVIN
jgi:CubicO group peptidase (beta-lactamase class C family)